MWISNLPQTIRTYFKSNTYSSAGSHLNRPNKKRDIAQCANCQRYGHTKNCCHHTPRCVKCADNHLTSQCPRKERSSNACCVLYGGKHPANCKDCMVYKDLLKNTFPPLRPKIYTPPPNLKQTLHTHTTWSNKRSNR
jgi:hypothetical protein